jgi:hypothetical protein
MLVCVRDIWCPRHLQAMCLRLILVVVPFLSSLSITRVGPAHANITAYAYTAALLGNSAAERSALGQTRELLCAKDLQDGRPDFQTVSYMVVAR